VRLAMYGDPEQDPAGTRSETSGEAV